jgi:type VI protein secretion system component Hcp
MSKKKSTKKPSVKVNDLRARKNPKGGSSDMFLKLDGIKGESQDDKHKDQISSISTSLPAISPLNFKPK